MDQLKIGQFIMKRRKEKNLTQEQLAQKLNLSNKTISKWETGKCMPDYGTIHALCRELEITVAELMDGELCDKDVHDDQQLLELLKRIQKLEQQKTLIVGVLLICIGISLFVISQLFGGTTPRDVISGVLLGLSIGESLAGVYIVARTLGTKE